MKYLVRKSGSGRAHHWTGTDTVCRMASTGGLSMKRYLVVDATGTRPICQMCASVSVAGAKVTNLQDWQQSRENERQDVEYAHIQQPGDQQR